ncbi:cobalamin biosynthesis protein [Kitasatospora sp. NPDC098663]|uniref:cobalamin biosynthesis protein n=1 Tax=Kitasatospora sp. NPDC098663 TaxID=3364096 RepID=UPI0037FFE7C1
MIGLVALNGTGRLLADEIHAAWPETTRIHTAVVSACFGPTEALEYALGRDDLVVCLAPVATTVRLLIDGLHLRPGGPGLVSLDLDLRYAVPLTGRDSGADELAEELAALLGVRAVLTSSPPPATAPPVAQPGPVLRVTDRAHPGEDVLLVHPRTLVVGVGAGGGATDSELMRLITDTLAEHGLARASIARLATVAGKADHPEVRWAAFCLGGVPVDEHPAAALASVAVPNPSDLVGAAVGTASVAEAAALASAPGGELVATKRKSAAATVAIARAAVRGRLAVVGLGPGAHDLLVPRALAELRRASAVVGAPGAVGAVAELLRPGTRRIAADDGAGAAAGAAVDPTVDMAVDMAVDLAVDLAAHGHAVALVALGDGAALSVPPGAYDVHRVPGLPLHPLAPDAPAHPQGDPA